MEWGSALVASFPLSRRALPTAPLALWPWLAPPPPPFCRPSWGGVVRLKSVLRAAMPLNLASYVGGSLRGTRYDGGGIYRHVWLTVVTTPSVFIAPWGIYGTLRASSPHH